MVEEYNNNNNNRSKWKILKAIRPCLETSDWNIDLALFSSVIYFLWLVHLAFHEQVEAEGENEFFEHFGNVFSCLGFFLILSDTEHPTPHPRLILLYIIQFFISLSLLWGVSRKKKLLLEFWIFYTLCLGILNVCWVWTEALLLWEKLELVSWVRLGGTQVGFYGSNTFYAWRIWSLRGQLLDSSGDDPSEPSNLCPVLCIRNVSCNRKDKTGFFWLLGAYHFVPIWLFSKYSINEDFQLGSSNVVPALVTLFVSVPLAFAMHCPHRGTFALTSAMMGSLLTQLLWIYLRPTHGMFSVLITRFLLIDFPVSISLFVFRYRRAALTQQEREETQASDPRDSHRFHRVSSQARRLMYA